MKHLSKRHNKDISAYVGGKQIQCFTFNIIQQPRTIIQTKTFCFIETKTNKCLIKHNVKRQAHSCIAQPYAWFPLDRNAIVKSHDQNRFWLTLNVSLYIYHFSTVVDFSSEKYSGSTGHRSSWYQQRNLQ